METAAAACGGSLKLSNVCREGSSDLFARPTRNSKKEFEEGPCPITIVPPFFSGFFDSAAYLVKRDSERINSIRKEALVKTFSSISV